MNNSQEVINRVNAELTRAQLCSDAFDHLQSQLTQAQGELAKFHEAMEREKAPKWRDDLKDLARWLDDYASTKITEVIEYKLKTAARELCYMANCFTLKANFVPSELKIKELEGQLTQAQSDNARLSESHAHSLHQRDAALKLAGDALDGLTKPLYQQGASQNDVVNCIKRRDRDIHAALAAIKACGVELG